MNRFIRSAQIEPQVCGMHCVSHQMRALFLAIALVNAVLSIPSAHAQRICIVEVDITAADEQRLLGRSPGDDQTGKALVRMLKCMEIQREEVVALPSKFAPLGILGKEAMLEMANAGFNCTGAVHPVLDLSPATRKLIPSEQFIYECKLIQHESLACPIVIVRLIPPPQLPGISLKQHKAFTGETVLSEQTTFYGCQ